LAVEGAPAPWPDPGVYEKREPASIRFPNKKSEHIISGAISVTGMATDDLPAANIAD